MGWPQPSCASSTPASKTSTSRPSGLDRRNTLQLAQGAWLKAHENFIITGLTGTGKTWLACAFGCPAARLDHTVLYLRMPRLFEDLAMARLDGRFPRLIDKLARVQLLILGDWGTHTLNDQQRLDLLENFERALQAQITMMIFPRKNGQG
ncbi:ATP-binding protein [Bradyrhizobium sp. AS23.2]|uniref:ATP-binding protein n=1 Tax=Bradyrhizobium sp. AS23.2 TaxID=1680155 RepID=UPI0032E055F4